MRQKLSRKRKEYLTRRADIQSAAEKVFAAKGFYDSSMDEIARRAEFGTGSLYKYFKGKKDLYFSLIDEKVGEITGLVRVELGKDLSPMDKIELVLRLQLDFMQRNRDFFKIYISERNRFEWTIKDDLGKGVHEKFLAYIGDLEEVMRDGIEKGQFKEMDPRDMAHAFVGIVNSFMFEWIMSPGTYSLVSKAPIIMDIFFDGVQSPTKRR
ncbi:MAG: TetR/AcrR family transcriptional regulator [Deltaproteobacteria bacterium]|nr:TetR/AcrR family transcriptional regulator [Deltaproteobacteria bacterium]